MHAATDPATTLTRCDHPWCDGVCTWQSATSSVTGSSVSASSAPPSPSPDTYLPHVNAAELQHLLVSASDAGMDTAPYLRELSRRHWGSGADTSASDSLRRRPPATRSAA